MSDRSSGTSRRDLLKRAALGGLAAGLSGCNADEVPGAGARPDPGEGITAQSVAEAEKLQALRYSPAERAQLLEAYDEQLREVGEVRAAALTNADAPASIFNPVLPRRRIRRQKNVVTLAGTYDAPGPSGADDIAFASVAQLGVWLRAGVLSSEDLTRIYLKRIEDHDRRLRAFITVTAGRALADARRADQELAAGRDRGPLHGVPYGLKDLVDVKGVRTTWGATPYKDRIAEGNARVYERLRGAGAVMLGKTSCGALAYGDQWFDARTRNPWNTDEGSSGSSAGSAAAVAAGLCAFAIGTETLGSIISPSERCGAVGLRPTFGRVSRLGVMALSWSMDKVGPICRKVEDAALVLGAINGHVADDPSSARIGFTYDGAADLSAMTVGVSPAAFEAGDDVDRAGLRILRETGVKVKEIGFPDYPLGALINLLKVEAAAAFAELTLTDADDQLAWQDPEAWPNTFRRARFISAVDFVQMDRLRRKLMIELADLFDGVDAIFGPHDADGALTATNLAGYPQLAVPIGFAQTPTRGPRGSAGPDRGPVNAATARTPRGVSLWAGLFDESVALRVGRAIEAAAGFSGARPPGFSR